MQIKGLDRFRSTMKKAGADLTDMKMANQEVAQIVVDRAQVIGPRRTGTLMGSLRAGRLVARARTRSQLVYANPIHWGWASRHIKPNRFLMNAANDTEDLWQQTYLHAMQKICNQVRGV